MAIEIKDKKITLSLEKTEVINIDDLKEILPEQKEDLVLNTEAKKVDKGKVSGKLSLLHVKDAATTATFFPETKPTDCALEVKLPSNWRFDSSFYDLPENYIGDGEFEDSFLADLVFTEAELVLATAKHESYKEGLHFKGTVDLAKSHPLKWLSIIEWGAAKKKQKTMLFQGTIDKVLNRIELVHEIADGFEVHDKLSIQKPKLVLFSALEEDNVVGSDGIRLEGELLLKSGQPKTLALAATVPPHGFYYLGLEAYAKGEPVFLDDIMGAFGIEGKLIPEGVVQPGLDTFRAFVHLEQKSLYLLHLRLRTGEWKMFADSDKFKVKDVYLDLQVRNMSTAQQNIAIELGGIMEIYKGQLLTYAKVELSGEKQPNGSTSPDYEIGGHLLGGSKIQVGDIITDATGNKNLPAGLKNLKVNKLDFTANPSQNRYSFALGIESEWKVGDTEYKLKKLGGHFSYHKPSGQTTATKEFGLYGQLQIGQTELSAAVDVGADTWKIMARLRHGEQLDFKELDTTGKAKAQLPAKLTKQPSFSIKNLEARYEKGGKWLFDGHTFIPITIKSDKPADGTAPKPTQLNLDVHLHFEKTKTTYEGYLKAKVKYHKLPLQLNATIAQSEEGKANKKSLEFGLEENKKVTLPDLVESLMGKEASLAVPDLPIGKLGFKVDDETLEVNILIGKEIKLKKEKDAKKIKATKKPTLIPDAKVKLSKDKEKKDNSDLGLSYLKFTYKRTQKAAEGKITETKDCSFHVQAAGKFDDDLDFKLLSLEYNYHKEGKKPDPNYKEIEAEEPETTEDGGETTEDSGETPAPKEPEKPAVKTETKWDITGLVNTIAYGKPIQLETSYAKTAKEKEDGSKEIKHKLKLAAKGTKKKPLISMGDNFKIKDLEIIIENKDKVKALKK